MSFRNLSIARSYISFGVDNIAESLIIPALKCAKRYDRSVGFFSSGVLSTIFPGIIQFARNKGKIRLIASPRLSSRDVEAIDIGYAKREQLAIDSFSNDFVTEVEQFDDRSLQLLVELISKDVLDIQIAITDTIGDYHDKLGIFEDEDGNVIAFFGSANCSENAYKNNYERVRVVKSWIPGEKDFVRDECQEFENLWHNNSPFVHVLQFRETAQRHLLEIVERRAKAKNLQTIIVLRDYQNEAIQAWINHNYNGFFVMATGTGKTWTAIYAAKELVKKHPAMIVICAPYKHLVRQWAEDVERAFPGVALILVSSENPKWESQLTEEILRSKYDRSHQVIAISTIVSFNSDRFRSVINKSNGDRLLIVDEAHRFTSRLPEIKDQYAYMLGLSATPYSGRSTEKGDELMSFFGGRVFNLPIEQALGKFLVNYNYHPIFVEATSEEEELFKFYSAKIASCFSNGACIDPDNLVKHLRNRLRVISMAKNKIEKLDSILDQLDERDHVVVYCGDGKLFDENRQTELRHIQYVKGVLDHHGYRGSQFTATENMAKRMELVDAFNKGEITALAAIRCLDEGINIPSIKSALILSSNDDYREFVQRRGRILRRYGDKEVAEIYDVIVLSSTSTQGMAIIELRRYLEYARLALNSDKLLDKLNDLLRDYGLTLEQISMMAESNVVEESLDE